MLANLAMSSPTFGKKQLHVSLKEQSLHTMATKKPVLLHLPLIRSPASPPDALLAGLRGRDHDRVREAPHARGDGDPVLLRARHAELVEAAVDLRRRMNNELNFPPNLGRLVLGCIDADFCK